MDSTTKRDSLTEQGLNDAGFYINHTGGGCTAWRVDLPNDHYLMVTDDASHELTVGGEHAIGVYSPDGECVAFFIGSSLPNAVNDDRRYGKVLDFLKSADGAVLYWQVPAHLARDFTAALQRGLIRFDEDADCYVHLRAVLNAPGSWHMGK